MVVVHHVPNVDDEAARFLDPDVDGDLLADVREGGGFGAIGRSFADPKLVKVIETEKIDTIFMVPTMFIRLMKLPEEVRNKYDMSSLRHALDSISASTPDP